MKIANPLTKKTAHKEKCVLHLKLFLTKTFILIKQHESGNRSELMKI